MADDLTTHLLVRLREVRQRLGLGLEELAPEVRFADAVDSMGLVEFVALVSDDLGTAPDQIEQAVGRRFTTVADLARALQAARFTLAKTAPLPITPAPRLADRQPLFWLSGAACHLPATVEPADLLDAQLQRPTGWLETHAGIRQRRIWDREDPLAGAAQVAEDALGLAGVSPASVGALLVTAEAPPQAVGLAATLHHRLGLPSSAVALEIGGACAGFLAALWTARHLLAELPVVLILAVEAPSRWLTVQPGPAGEAAALFGDAAAACVLSRQPAGLLAIPFHTIELGADGSAADLVQVRRTTTQIAEVVMEGPALAGRAVRTMAEGVEQALLFGGLDRERLEAIIAHGGNGRLPALVAQQVGVATERVWSLTAEAGNLGSASLPAAWAVCGPIAGPVIWTTVGAGLVWGWALSGHVTVCTRPVLAAS